MPNIVTKTQMMAETIRWRDRVRTAGGNFEWNSIAIANTFVKQLRVKPYYNNIKYLLPMLGAGVNAARIPLIDRLNVGAATNNNFVNSDFSQSTGLKGNGGNKVFDTLIKASDLGGGTNNAGFGYWARQINTGGWTFGSRPAQGLYGFYLNQSPRELFYYGNGDGSQVDLSSPSTLTGYYCQRSSATSRAIYKAGVLIGSTSSSTTDAGSSGANIFLMGIDTSASFSTDGQCSVAYLTDGTMSANDIGDFHSLLNSYLIGPTGK